MALCSGAEECPFCGLAPFPLPLLFPPLSRLLSLFHYLYLHPLLLLFVCWYFVNLMAPRVLRERERRGGDALLALALVLTNCHAPAPALPPSPPSASTCSASASAGCAQFCLSAAASCVLLAVCHAVAVERIYHCPLAEAEAAAAATG